MKKSEKNEFFQITHHKDYLKVKWFNGMKDSDNIEIMINIWHSKKKI